MIVILTMPAQYAQYFCLSKSRAIKLKDRIKDIEKIKLVAKGNFRVFININGKARTA